VLHPTALYLEDEFAKQGISVVPFLQSKLREAKRELTIRDIVGVFAEMQRTASYNVRRDSDLIELLQQRVAAMRGLWHPMTQRMLDEIQNGAER
jgi:hypothetical protein